MRQWSETLQPNPEFELGSLGSFLIMITVFQSVHLKQILSMTLN